MVQASKGRATILNIEKYGLSMGWLIIPNLMRWVSALVVVNSSQTLNAIEDSGMFSDGKIGNAE